MASSAIQDVIAEANEAFVTNADYDTAPDSTKALAFSAACRKFIGLRMQIGSHGGRGSESVQYDTASLQQMLKKAEAYASQISVAAASGVTEYFDASCYRS